MSPFEAMYREQGFAPSLGLFKAFFKILKANNDILGFYGRNSLIIFIDHKDSIKHQDEHFAIVGSKGSFDWGLKLGWSHRYLLQFFSFSFRVVQLYFTRIVSLPFKYNVFKSLGIRPKEDCYSIDTNHFFYYCFLLSLSFHVSNLSLIYFAASIVHMDKISMPQNFSLNRNAV